MTPPTVRYTSNRPDTAPEVLDNPETVSEETVLPGFVFEVRKRIFDLQW